MEWVEWVDEQEASGKNRRNNFMKYGKRKRVFGRNKGTLPKYAEMWQRWLNPFGMKSYKGYQQEERASLKALVATLGKMWVHCCTGWISWCWRKGRDTECLRCIGLYWEGRCRHFSLMPSKRTNSEGHKLKHRIWVSEHEEEFLYCEDDLKQPWNRLPRDLVEFPCLKMFKTYLNKILCNLLQVKVF